MKEFNRIIGYKSVKKELITIVDMMRNPEKYEKVGVNIPSGLLLHGQPGLGKTLMANCLIKASKRKAFIIRKDTPNGDFVKEIKKTFDNAKKESPSIVFLDDLDKFANSDTNHKNAEEYVTVQSCIDDVKYKNVFVLATANDIDNLPESLYRAGRFDVCIKIYPPKLNDAESIIKHCLKNKKISNDINYLDIAKLLEGRSCAVLESIINKAGINAAFEKRDTIEMNDMVKAIMRLIFDAPESDELDQNEFIDNICTHEAGHIVVSEILEPESVSFATVKKHDGETSGFVSYHNNDNYFESITFMENRIKSLLAGKAAIEIVYGIIDVGSTIDIDRASEIVRRLIGEYGKYGLFYISIDDYYSRSGTDYGNRRMLTIQNELERYYQESKKILIENREFLSKLTEYLKKHKVILHSEIQEIKNNCSTFQSPMLKM